MEEKNVVDRLTKGYKGMRIQIGFFAFQVLKTCPLYCPVQY